ncbi:MAG: CRISPR-associated endonuclease Cas2 [Bacilli bacterium]|nr:CRISPR-associated endonuclease Cas2 [Bacilli bacterium]
MRTIVFFDLPNVYARDRKNYIKFRKFLINEGFLMLQESVYSKLTLNSGQTKYLMERVRKNAPQKGIVQMLTVTEKQYAQIEYVIGSNNSKIVDNDERLLIL